MSYKLLILALLGVQFQHLLAQNVVTKTQSECAGRGMTLDCTSTNPEFNNTIFLDQVIKGVRSDPSSQCSYTTGDCYEETSNTICTSTNQKCTIVSLASAMASCNQKKSEYYQARYSCVPDAFAHAEHTIDICSSNSSIHHFGDGRGDGFGIITSPGYPSYTPAPTACVRRLSAPQGKTFKVWISTVKIKSPTSSECTDYLKISDTTGILEYCGTQQPIATTNFCSNEIYVAYKAASANSPLAQYSGFKLYYEVIDLQPWLLGCSTGSPPYPSEPTRTSTGPTTFGLANFQATPREQFKVCKGETRTFTAPTPYHVFYLEDYSYGVSASNSTCPDLSSPSCIAPQSSVCTMANKCTISYTSNVILPECGGQSAAYLFGTYRYIPINSLTSHVVCQDVEIDGDSSPNGVIASRMFPTFETNQTCQMNLRVSDPNKVFRFYVTDINIDPPNFVSQAESRCEKSYLRFSDLATSKTFCGYLAEGRTYSYTSCSNQVSVNYKTSSLNLGMYKGFRAYYEVVDKEFECPEITTTTTLQSITVTPRDNNTMFSSILTTDGQRCELPFFYQGAYEHYCVDSKDGEGHWCSVSGDFYLDGLKSKCKLGTTEVVGFRACAKQQKKLECPRNYLMLVLSSESFVTEDNTCAGNSVCSAADSLATAACAGKNGCSWLASSTIITNCNNKPPAFTETKFTCVPDTVHGFISYDVCGSDTTIPPTQGFIFGPGFPGGNYDCSRYFSLESRSAKRLTVYVVSFSVGTSAIIGTKCQNSFVEFNGGAKMCGTVKTSVIYRGCANGFNVKLSEAPSRNSSFKLYYEVDEAASCDPAESTSVSELVSFETTPDTAAPATDYSSQASASANDRTSDGAVATDSTVYEVTSDKSTWYERSSPSSGYSSESSQTDSTVVNQVTSDSSGSNPATQLATEETSDQSDASTARPLTTQTAVQNYTLTFESNFTLPSISDNRTTLVQNFTDHVDYNYTLPSLADNRTTTTQTKTSTTTTATSETTTTSKSLEWTWKTYLIIIIPSVVSSIITGFLIFCLIKCCCTRSNQVSPSRGRRRRTSSMEMEDY